MTKRTIHIANIGNFYINLVVHIAVLPLKFQFICSIVARNRKCYNKYTKTALNFYIDFVLLLLTIDMISVKVKWCECLLWKNVIVCYLKGNFVELLNYKIYSEDGTLSYNKPIMVLVHGLGGGYYNWFYQVRRLKQRYDLVLVELPSHGECKFKMSEMELDFGVVSRKILEVLDYLKITKATFLGVSLGTMAVKYIVLNHPDRVEKYVLAGPIGKFTLLLKAAIHLALFLLPIAPLDFVLTLASYIAMPHKQSSCGRNMFMSCARRIEQKEFIAWCKVILSFAKVQAKYESVMEEETNGLYIVGELDHFFMPMLTGDKKRVKNMVILKDAGHLCSIDKHEEVNRLIVEFQESGTVNLEPALVA